MKGREGEEDRKVRGLKNLLLHLYLLSLPSPLPSIPPATRHYSSQREAAESRLVMLEVIISFFEVTLVRGGRCLRV